MRVWGGAHRDGEGNGAYGEGVGHEGVGHEGVSSDSDAQPNLSGALRGRTPVRPRWVHVRDLNNEAAVLLHAGETRRARELLEEAVLRSEPMDPLVPAEPAGGEGTRDDRDGDAGASDDAREDEGDRLDLRARVLLNLAAAHDAEGRPAQALRVTDEALAAAASAIELIDDDRGTRSLVITGTISRAQTLTLLDRSADAHTELDAAEARLAAPELHAVESREQLALLRFSLHNARTGFLIREGRLREAADAAQRSLVAAGDSGDAGLAGHAYANLGAIAQRTGDGEATRFYLELARSSFEGAGNAAARQLATENLARAAVDAGRLAESERWFREAAALASEAGLATRMAACRIGLAAVQIRQGRAAAAAKQLRDLIADLERAGATDERYEAYGYLGDAEAARGRFARAEEAFVAARALARSVHDRCRIDLRRAEVAAQSAGETMSPAQRQERFGRAIALAVPVSLATEALRDDFAPGATRERWTTSVAAPARALALHLALVAQDARLLHELIENAAASSTFQTDAGTDVDRTSTAHSSVPQPSAIEFAGAFTSAAPAAATAAPAPDVGITTPAPAAMAGFAEALGGILPAAPAWGTAAPRTGTGAHGAFAASGTGTPETAPSGTGAFAASGIAASGTTASGAPGFAGPLRFAPPPRVIAIPGEAPALASFIAAAESTYGVTVRSAEVVASW